MSTGEKRQTDTIWAFQHQTALCRPISCTPRPRGETFRKGFSLVELLIVVAIIAIIAAVAIPSLLRSRAAANEGATVGTLRTVATFQAVFRSQGEVDQNSNGVGEYALLGELSSELAMRPATNRIANPIYMSQQFYTGGNTGTGVASKCGFFYKIFLSNATPGDPTATGTDKELGGSSTVGGPVPDPAAISQQETAYALYAWPMQFHVTGSRCFFSNQSAEIYFSKMDATTYDNLTPTPAADAAYVSGATVFRGKIAWGVTRGNDTNHWFPAGGQ
jgi:prepilin-type N-terminal cleavage/methylation domain-containing protein